MLGPDLVPGGATDLGMGPGRDSGLAPAIRTDLGTDLDMGPGRDSGPGMAMAPASHPGLATEMGQTCLGGFEMIISFENGLLESRWPDLTNSKESGIMTFGPDQEEWLGIRSQLLAQIYGWAAVLVMVLAMPAAACDKGCVEYEGNCACEQAPAEQAPSVAPSDELPPRSGRPSYEAPGVVVSTQPNLISQDEQ